MRTSLAYIDDVMERAVAAEGDTPSITAKNKESAQKSGRKVIGGFRVFDEVEERKHLDDIIIRRRAMVEEFRKDRAAIRETLGKLDIKPMAICPSSAWYKLCKTAGLYMLTPDKNGRVGIDPSFGKRFKALTTEKTKAALDSFVASKSNWPDYIRMLFPDQRQVYGSHAIATVMLPDPPADVAATLVKAKGLLLSVAVVADAIRIAEKPSELYYMSTLNPKDLWAQAQGYEDYADWIKRDPIVFTQQGTATAIIAQFGDFPIEKDVVDAVTKADDLFPDRDAFAHLRPESVTVLRGPNGETVTLAFDGQSATWVNAHDASIDSASWTGRR